MADDWKEDIIKNKLGGKRDWTEEERAELCFQLDKEFDKQYESKLKGEGNRIKDGWTEENWKEKMAEHPIFSPYLQEESSTDGEAPVNALSEGLAQLKYHPDHNTPLEIAKNYKEEGNNHFKYKKYRFAIASFSEGIKQQCEDQELNAQLYSNRAASQMRLGNNRSALKDCASAVAILPTYKKAIDRAIECASRIPSWDEVVEWCNIGIKLDPNNELYTSSKTNAIKEKKKEARDARKKLQIEKENSNDINKLVKLIKMRGIHLGKEGIEQSASIVLSDLESNHPASRNNCVHIDENGSLVWPVVFLYPEYKETDFIEKFNEEERLIEHLNIMFNPNEFAPWDIERKYLPNNLIVYFEDSNNKLVEVNPDLSLLKVISNPKYRVLGGTPSFYILVKDSPFLDAFKKKY